MFFKFLYKSFILTACVLFGYSVASMESFFWFANPLKIHWSQSFLIQEPFERDLQIAPVKEAYNIIAREYYGFNSIKKDDLVHGMIKGMVESLGDVHSEFLDEEKRKELHEAIEWNFEGIWAYVGKIEKGVLIRHVFENSPAKEWGLQDGDIIEKVWNEGVKELTISEAVKKIRGPANSKVTLSILRIENKKEQRFDREIIRKQVQIPSVIGKVLSGSSVGMITVGIFWENTNQEFINTYNRLEWSGITSLIIDLRDNPGWLLSTAIDIVSNFVENGKVIVETRGNMKELNKKYYSDGLNKKPLPTIILINENSASASEITAGSLQDYKKAIIVGMKSYWKWSVQEPIPLHDGSELKLTIARWYTPNGKWIDKIGIIPDVSVALEKEDYSVLFDRQLEKWKEIAEYWSKGKTFEETLKRFTTTSF